MAKEIMFEIKSYGRVEARVDGGFHSSVPPIVTNLLLLSILTELRTQSQNLSALDATLSELHLWMINRR